MRDGATGDTDGLIAQAGTPRLGLRCRAAEMREDGRIVDVPSGERSPGAPSAPRRRPQEPHRSARRPTIDVGRCTGCGRCVAVCDPHLLSLEVVRWKKSAVLHEPERCTNCNACAATCPFHAIAMRKQAAVR